MLKVDYLGPSAAIRESLARSETFSTRPGKRIALSGRRNGFTMIESLVVIAVIATIAVLLVPAMGQLIKRSKGVACLGNLSNVGRMTLAYAQDYRMNFPILWVYTGRNYNFAHPTGDASSGGSQGAYNLSWYRALGENGYAEDPNDYTWAYSPSDSLSRNEVRGWAERNQPYGLNIDYETTPFNSLKHQGPPVPFYATASQGNGDRAAYWFQYNRARGASRNKLWARHGGVCNVWFTDGRAEAIPESAIFERLPGANFYRSSKKENVAR